MTAGDRVEREATKLGDAISSFASCLATVDGSALGEGLIQLRESADRIEAAFADGVRRFDKSGEYAADGALSMVAWLRWKCRLSGGAAAERVSIARQLDKLPKIEQAFSRGDLGYQHVAAIARTADNVGAAAVRKEEGQLLKAAETMDPGQFTGVVKSFEHRVDAAFALAEANRAYARRYLHISEPSNGLMHLEGLLDTEGGATLKTALDALMPAPNKDDDRSGGQRRADALVDLARKALDGSKLGSVGGQRPHLVITASIDTLAGVPGAPPAQLEGVGPISTETAQRYACDSTISYVRGLAELDAETSHAHRRIPPATRRALVARDRDCVFPGCHRPPTWCDGHHLVWWTRGGKTEVPNLALVCGRHHRMVHEEGWTLARNTSGRWVATPPGQGIEAHARSA
jgi:uncharacterized protein DUF222